MKKTMTFPEKPVDKQNVMQLLDHIQMNDQDWQNGKMFGFVFHPEGEAEELVERAFMTFAHTNRLNPTSFPSLRKFETEVVSMCADLMHGNDQVVGTVTSGGTESIIMSVLVAREMAKDNKGPEFAPELVLPVTAHPAFLKACHYLNVLPRIIPVREDKRVDTGKMEEAVNDHTIMLVGSAPCFPFGVIDPIEEISRLAEKYHILMHVDACMGGFMLPFMKDIGYPVPTFDFNLPGVTSISLDAHKYGYAMKPASVILYRNPELRMKQFFVYTDWPGGIFASTALLGSRSGGSVAGAWALMNYLGKEGYREIAGQVMKATEKLKAAVGEIPGLEVISDPDMSLLAIASEDYDILHIADLLEERGWHPDRQQFPDSIHLTISWGNVKSMDSFIRDLHEVTEHHRKLTNENKRAHFTNRLLKGASGLLPGKTIGKLARMLSFRDKKSSKSHPSRQASVYGLTGHLKNRDKVSEAITQMMDGMYRI